VSDSDSNTDMKRARGLFPWLFLFGATAFLVSVLLLPFLRDLRAQAGSGVYQCVEICKPISIKVYDGPRGICECQDPKEK